MIDNVTEPTEAPSTIGDRIRTHRERKGMSQSDLARLVKMTPQAINLIESGATKAPTPANLLAIADVLGVSMRELITGAASGSSAGELVFRLAEDLPEEVFPVQMSLELATYGNYIHNYLIEY